MIETPGAPESVKRELLQQANSAFERRAQYFYRTHPTGVLVHVDITNVDMVSPQAHEEKWRGPEVNRSSHRIFLTQPSP